MLQHPCLPAAAATLRLKFAIDFREWVLCFMCSLGVGVLDALGGFCRDWPGLEGVVLFSVLALGSVLGLGIVVRNFEKEGAD